MLLRDGLNNHLDPELVPEQERADGCVARRREAYYDQIADQGNLNARLAQTTPLGHPVQRITRDPVPTEPGLFTL